MRIDPRYAQIVVLSLLLTWGAVGLDFEIQWVHALVILITAQLTQWVGSRWVRIVYDPRSALISSLSLCLLLRTNLWWLAAMGALVTIASKFLLRVDGRHLFNPTAFGLVAMMLLTDRVWVSAGQWGHMAVFAFAVACLGSLVVRWSERSDITLAFGLFYAMILVARSVWLSEPMSIPLHRLQNGALLVFAFFMISDPRTTPDTRWGRVFFALLVALGAAAVHFVMYRTNGLLWSLVCLSPLVPLLNRLFPGQRYTWPIVFPRGVQHAA